MRLTPEEQEVITKMRAEKARTEYKLRPLEEISSEDKSLAFDRLHHFALRIWNDTKKERYLDEDSRHYAFEEVMQLLTTMDKQQEFWNAFNSLTK